MCAPDEPASGYLVDAPGGSFVMDLGPGALGELQRRGDPSTVDLLLSHLHADHCMDIPGLMVWRRYHPTAPARRRNLLYGPADTALRVGHAAAETGAAVDDLTDSFDLRVTPVREPFEVAGVTVTAYPMTHPIEAHGFRVDDGRRVLAYTGDTAYCPEVVELAEGADVLLCEATWGDGAMAVPEAMHMSGAEAGRVAREAGVAHLVLTHIPPYGDRAGALAAARAEFAGEIGLARRGMVIDLG